MSVPSAQASRAPFDAAWLDHAAAGLDASSRLQLQHAATWAGPAFGDQRALTEEPLSHHAVGVTRILAALQSDVATRIAALLAAMPMDLSAPIVTATRDEPLVNEFGTEIARLVQGTRALLRLSEVARRANDKGATTRAQTEMQRKMLLAMAADLRIVLIHLASRLQSLRWYAVTKLPCPVEFARETLDLYAPLVHRLGIWQIKWEIEDLAFRFFDPDHYKKIAALLEEKRVEREAFIQATIARTEGALRQEGIHAEVSGRPKHIYSIWTKMRLKGLDFNQLYDLRAVRIIVEDVPSCYAALARVHELWTPITEEFDDYIARPKPNGYQSLHTVVNDPAARPFEIQIRTRQMHQFAEYGMAAHWHYKEAGAKGGQVVANNPYDRQLAWMRQLLAWNKDLGFPGPIGVPARHSPSLAPTSVPERHSPSLAPTSVPERHSSSLAPARVPERHPSSQAPEYLYVLTPQARVIPLPVGSTPLDFAYHVHTDLGHRCRGARVDGHLVPLNTPLVTGQTVEILAAKTGGPSRDWLNQQRGFLASTRGRAKVRQWFNAIELQQRITQGQALVEKELQRLGKTAIKWEQLARELGFARADDLFMAVAKESVTLRQIETVLQVPMGGQGRSASVPTPPGEKLFEHKKGTRQGSVKHIEKRRATRERKGDNGVLVAGVAALMTQLARCCHPLPPDAIVGFVTKGRGVSIHRADCRHYAALAGRALDRTIQATWGETDAVFYPVEIRIDAQDRLGLLHDLSEAFARLHLPVRDVTPHLYPTRVQLVFTVDVQGGQVLKGALAALAKVAGVTRVGRR